MTSNGLLESCKFTILQGMESIVLDETELVMYVGQTYRMTYSVFPATTSDTTLKWTPTNSKVVTVDNTGFFTAKNTGTCVVTVQAMDGSGVFTTCTVTVLRNASGKQDILRVRLERRVDSTEYRHHYPSPARQASHQFRIRAWNYDWRQR